tara:strand:- start:706 stop:3654 length:2949 start_codon:yes stop_codon:yes gene_type:complete
MAIDTSTISKRVLGTMSARRGSSASSDSDDESMLDWFKAWRETIDLQREIQEGISDTALKEYKATIEYWQDLSALEFKYAQLEDQTNLGRAKIYKDILVANIGAQKAYYAKTRVADQGIIRAAELGFEKLGGDLVINAFSDIVLAPTVREDGTSPPKLIPSDPGFAVTMKGLIDALNNSQPGRDIIVLRGDGFVDIEATKAQFAAADRAMDTSAARGLFASLSDYNGARRQELVIDDRLKQEERRFTANLNGAISRLEANPDDPEALRNLELVQEGLEQADAVFMAENNLISQEVANSRIQNALARQKTSEEANAAMRFAKKMLNQDDNNEIEEGLARGISNSGFRAWAADHGFDRLGSVEFDENGNVDVSTYREGGDDVGALLAWKKQSMRKAGNYGVRGIQTGEIWRVELKDGSEVTGHRLKRHAADPMGSIRIVTADGARVITPAEVSQAQIEVSPTKNLSRIDRRAKRQFKKNASKYASISEASRFRAGEIAEGNIAQTEDLEYIIDPETGQGIQKDEFNAAKEQARNSAAFVFDVDGVKYIVDPATSDMYSVSAAGAVKLDEAAKSEISKSIPDFSDRTYLGLKQSGTRSAGLVRTEQIDGLIKGDISLADLQIVDASEYAGFMESDTSIAAMGFEVSPDAPSVTMTGPGQDLAGIYVVEPQDDTRRITDEDELELNTALDQYLILEPMGSEEGEPDRSTSGVGSVGPTVLESMVESLNDPNRTPEEKTELAKIYNERFPEDYRTAYGNLDLEGLGYEPASPTYEPPEPKDPPGLMAESREVADADVDEFTPEEMGVAPTDTAPGGTPAASKSAPLPGKARPPTGKKTPTSAKSVPMNQEATTDTKSKFPNLDLSKVFGEATKPEQEDPAPMADAGEMSMDVNLPRMNPEDNVVRLKEERPDMGVPDNVSADLGPVKNLVAKVTENLKKRKEKRAEKKKAKKDEPDSLASPRTPGGSGVDSGGVPPTTDEDDPNEQR